MDEDTQDRQLRMQRVDEQILVSNGRVSLNALEAVIEGTNTTLLEYYEALRPADVIEAEEDS